MRLHGYCTECHRPKLVRVSGHGLAGIATRGIPQGICDECEDARLWPPGILSHVSREAYNAVGRARGFQFMTHAEREEAARSYDRMKKERR
jgi:hypothetical protein